MRRSALGRCERRCPHPWSLEQDSGRAGAEALARGDLASGSEVAEPRVTLLRDRYELLQTRGERRHRVVKAVDRHLGGVGALRMTEAGSDRGRDDLARAGSALRGLPPHPSLPLLREDFFDGDRYVLVMEWVEGTSLERLLQDQGTPGLPLSSVLAYLSGVAEALTFRCSGQFVGESHLGRGMTMRLVQR